MNKGITLIIKAFVAITLINGSIVLLMEDSYNGEGLLALAIILNTCILVSMITSGQYAFNKCKTCNWDRFLHEENPDGDAVVCNKFKTKEPELFVQLMIYNSFIFIIGAFVWMFGGISPWINGAPVPLFLLVGGLAGLVGGGASIVINKLEGVTIVVKKEDDD